MADWPSYGKYLQPIQQEPVEHVEAAGMEHGPPKRRERPGRMLLRTNLRVLLTPTEYVSWRDWFANTIGHGALEFNWTDPLDGVSKTTWIRRGRYSVTTTGGRGALPIKRIVSVTLESWHA